MGPLVVRGDRLVIGGRKGEGKSTFLLRVTQALTLGGPFLHWQGHGGCRVLALDMEQTQRDITRGLRAAGLAGSGLVTVLPLLGARLDLARDRDLHELGDVVAEVRPDVITLDPIYRLSRSDLNDPREAAILMGAVDELRGGERTGLIMGAHAHKHTRIGGLRMDHIAGAHTLVDGAETVVLLERTRPGAATLRVGASRSGALEPGSVWHLLFDAASGYRLDNIKREGTRDEQVLAVLVAAGRSLAAGEIAEELGVSQRTVERCLPRVARFIGRRDKAGRKLWRAQAPDGEEDAE